MLKHYKIYRASEVALVVKNMPANAGDIRDASSVPGLERSSGGGHENPLQYSCLENHMDRGVWWATVHRITKSQTHWSDLTHRVYIIQEEDYNHTLRDSDGALGWAIINSVALSGATNLLALYWASPWLRGKDSTANVEDTGDSCLIPGLRRSPGGGHENPLQYSCPENPMDRGAWWAIPWGH